MSDPGLPDDPFGAMPFLGDIMRALSGSGPLNWDAARQFAVLGATGGTAEPNVDPIARVRYGELARIVGPHVADVTGADSPIPDPVLMTRGEWATEALADYRPLFTTLATALTASTGIAADDDATDPMAQMMSGLSQMMAPAMLGMTVGSMVGSLAQRVFGVHDLPIARQRRDLMLVPGTIEAFATEHGLDVDEMRLWVLAHEIAGHVLFNQPTLRDGLAEMITQHVGGFRPDPSALADQLGRLEMDAGDPLASIQEALSDPTLLIGAVESDEQRALRPGLDAAVAMVIGYTDWVVDAVAVRVVGGNALTIADAVRQRRDHPWPDDVFVERLLGVSVGSAQVARGKAFVQGVVDRVGDDGVGIFLGPHSALATPAEIEAPGLWLARITGE